MVNHPNRSKRMRVYGGCFDGMTEWIVAARSQKEAATAFAASAFTMRQYASETGNDEDVAIAMAEPGIVFSRPASKMSAPLVKGALRYRRGDDWPPPSE